MPIELTSQERISWASFATLFVAFTVIGLVLYRGALLGPFLSDDVAYITYNPYLGAPWSTLFFELFDPAGDMRLYAMGNYAPLHSLAHIIEWRSWGGHTAGYHIVNVVLHALNSTLLIALLQASAIPRGAAILLGALFALHPANVEAVAWISQLKSLLALCFSLVALLAFRRHPIASTMLFACALLSKATAMFALPMAAAFFWAWRGNERASRRHGVGLALWLLVFIVYAPAQYSAFASIGQAYATPYPDLLTQLRSIAAIGARYLAMAATGYGTSAFHQPEPVHSNLAPWWIAGLLVAPLLLWRIASSLRNRSEEAAWWIGAATAFGPISQIFPFFYGMADRYLYFILPGLLGGVFLASKDLLAGRVADENAGNSIRRRALLIPRAALVGGVLLSLLFAFQAQTRVLLWRSMDNLDRDAVSHYPDGSGALFFGATMAVEQGDYDRAIELLRGAAERGHFFVQPFRVDLFDPLFDYQRFQDLLYENEGRRIAFARERGFRTQRQLMNIAESHELRGEYDESIALLERAIRKGGPLHEKLLERLVRVHQKRGDDRLPSTE